MDNGYVVETKKLGIRKLNITPIYFSLILTFTTPTVFGKTTFNTY
jgi:hypothetical protein